MLFINKIKGLLCHNLPHAVRMEIVHISFYKVQMAVFSLSFIVSSCLKFGSEIEQNFINV